MGKIIGWTIAKCKKCKCVFRWHCEAAWPFVDMEAVGTCDKCINGKSHECINEPEEIL